MTKHHTLPVRSGPAHYTVAYFDADGPQTVALEQGKAHTIGRVDSCDIVVKHGTVSRNHAILVGGSPPTIKDVGSRNGTYVSARRIPPNAVVPVDVGTLVQVGDVVLFVQRSLEEPDSSPPPTPDPNEMTATPGARKIAQARPHDLMMDSPAARELLEKAEAVARSDLSVLILGETGVGKERLAQVIHAASPRSSKSLISLNCAAFPETMVESELFGYERGAFTGAERPKRGLIAAADGGTLLLDEVGELTLPIQAKLLRVLEARELLPLGALKTTAVDIRVLAATNVGLREAVATGKFREDLYYRLNAVTLQIPPLRKRQDDILPLAMHFAGLYATKIGRLAPLFTAEANEALLRYPWPGNIRELKNVIERATLLAPSGIIEADAIPCADEAAFGDDKAEAPTNVMPVVAPRGSDAPNSIIPGKRRVLTPDEITAALARTGGDQREAARQLGVSRRTLINYLDRFELPRPRKRPG